jgi:hypothetical protein
MVLPQPIEYKQYSYGVFERKHYMECTTGYAALRWIENSSEEDMLVDAIEQGPVSLGDYSISTSALARRVVVSPVMS